VPSSKPVPALPDDYAQVLADLKDKIRSAQVQAHRAVNRGLIELYWSIGTTILERRAEEGWGAKVIEALATDLRQEFPQMKGLSRSNLEYMRRMAAAWPAFPLQVVGEMPWGHIETLLDKVDDQATRDWYATEALHHGWSRNVLRNQIKVQLHLRVGAAPSNFELTVPDGESELVQQMVKDPYNFEFLGLSEGSGGACRAAAVQRTRRWDCGSLHLVGGALKPIPRTYVR
jgi:predicted nuclease of restriction endonuclease-like (RecB) superfamily